MKNISYIPVAIIALLYACKSSPKTTQATDSIVTDTTTVVHTPKEETPIDYNKVKTLDTVYVTNAAGADVKEEPNAASATIKNQPYGTPLNVIEITKDWFGILEYITVEDPTDHHVTASRWEKKYVDKRLTGKITDIKLSAKDLKIITQLNHYNKSETYANGKPLNGYLEIELIDKALFEEKKQTAVEHILRDTNAIAKVKGVITLPSTQKNKTYKDRPNDEENSEEYTYYGQIEALNKYVITGTYYESRDCKLVDKTTGKETTAGGVPIVSPDLKNMICLYEDPYNSSTEIEVYQIKNTEPVHVVSLSFNNWIPELEKENMFWSTDGFLYVPVLHTSVYNWVSYSPGKNYNLQYIRIKIKS